MYAVHRTLTVTTVTRHQHVVPVRAPRALVDCGVDKAADTNPMSTAYFAFGRRYRFRIIVIYYINRRVHVVVNEGRPVTSARARKFVKEPRNDDSDTVRDDGQSPTRKIRDVIGLDESRARAFWSLTDGMSVSVIMSISFLAPVIIYYIYIYIGVCTVYTQI